MVCAHSPAKAAKKQSETSEPEGNSVKPASQSQAEQLARGIERAELHAPVKGPTRLVTGCKISGPCEASSQGLQEWL